MRGTSQRSTAEGLLTSMLLTRSLTASIQRIPLSASGTRMLSLLPMSSPALCFSSDFLFLPIEDGETLVKHMTVHIPCFIHTAQFFAFIDLLFTPENPKKTQKNFNLKKIHFETSCLIFTSSTAPFFFFPENLKKLQKNLNLKKIHFYCTYLSSSLCHPRSANLWKS